MDKVQLRRQLLQQRRSLPLTVWQENSDCLCQQLISLPLFQSAKTILGYFSLHQEPDLSSLFRSRVVWGFPRCVGQNLAWHRWTLGDSLQIGPYGITEPEADSLQLSPSEIDLMLVPAVACDRRGYRLGYGGGYYDRLLADPLWANIPTIGIVFEFAYLSALPVEPWDMTVSFVCTENRVYSPHKSDQ
jgi:5-formyltetrahydrofolate cyclo-ligase